LTELVITGLAAHYGPIQALKGVNVTVAAGELVALVGANGAGKTTLMRTLSGVLPASAGTVTYDGEEITGLSPDARVRLGISQVPEGRQVFGPMSVEDNLMLGAYTRPRREIADSLAHVYDMFPRLEQRHQQQAGMLSGGEQQMLALSRALMAKPKLLLLDEPSMGLSPILVDETFDAIVKLRDEGTTVFVVEQNAFKALAIADRGYVIETGRTVLTDAASALLEDERVKEAYLGV